MFILKKLTKNATLQRCTVAVVFRLLHTLKILLYLYINIEIIFHSHTTLISNCNTATRNGLRQTEKQMMTSLEIAGVTGKQHKNVMETIRKMEPAWVKVHGSKFRLMFREVEIGHGAVRQELVASIASAILTALGATSCVGA